MNEREREVPTQALVLSSDTNLEFPSFETQKLNKFEDTKHCSFCYLRYTESASVLYLQIHRSSWFWNMETYNWCQQKAKGSGIQIWSGFNNPQILSTLNTISFSDMGREGAKWDSWKKPSCLESGRGPPFTFRPCHWDNLGRWGRRPSQHVSAFEIVTTFILEDAFVCAESWKASSIINIW